MQQLAPGKYLGQNRTTFNADGLIVCEPKYISKVYEGWHFHENDHLSFILEGGNREQRKNKELQVKPGEVLFYEGGEVHQNLNTQLPSRNINIEFEKNIYSKYCTSKEHFFQRNDNKADIKFGMLKMYQETKNSDVSSILAVHSIFLSLFKDQENKKMYRKPPVWVNATREFLNDNWSANLSLSEIAKLVDIHPVTLSKSFPKFFSTNMGEYVRKIRIEKSLSLLKQSNSSLSEIAYQCGFFDQSHFIRLFKKYTGFLPNQFKKL
jgi:AraC family transcriptional regulator